MQNFVLHKKFYQINGIDESEYSKKALDRYEKLQLYSKLKTEGCSEALSLKAIGASRATLYRWHRRYNLHGLAGLEPLSKAPKHRRVATWTGKIERIVLAARRKYRLWGKAKLVVIIKKEHGIRISESMIGRILRKLVAQKRIKPVHWLYGRKRRQPRVFSRHAKRWKYGMKAKKPGELLQIDHMTIEVGGLLVKHFQAVCPVTKIAVKEAYRRATSQTASRFLEHVIEKLPFPLISLQVDGGSEFMGVFEDLCKKLGIPLYVLPPRKPKYNGTVERSNGTAKYEFYSQYNGPANLYSLRDQLKQFVALYNTVRPHQGLNYLTPFEYCSQLGLRP